MSHSFEEISQAVVNALAASEESRFLAGDVLAALPEGTSLKSLAGAVGRSTAYLSDLRTVAEAFPPETRALDCTWSVHRQAARAGDPQAWLERAVSQAWSVKQLREALVEAGEIKTRAGKKKLCPNCGVEL